MAKTKKDLQAELEALGVEFDPKAKVADLQALLSENKSSETPVVPEATVTEVAVDAAEQEQAVIEEKRSTEAPAATAKAGKRSAKALREEAERQEKEARKESNETTEAKPKAPVTPTRSRLERRAKGYRKSAEQVQKDKVYSLKEAVALAKKTSHVKFDATVEVHINLGVDPRQADQNVRDTLVLPAGTGKTVKIAVFTDDPAAAKQAGAAIAGTDEILGMLDKGVTDFDILIATPNLMAQLGKYARTLGPRGLMPNPKSGTVTTDIKKAVSEAQAGRVEYRVDSTGIVHLGIGKVSFGDEQLLENLQAVLDNIKANKPASLKGTYIEAIHLTTSMGPSITIDSAAA